MNKQVAVIVSIVVGLAVVGGGALAYTDNQNNKKEQERLAMEKKTEGDAMMKKEEGAAMEKDKIAKDGDAMKKDAGTMTKGIYTDYNRSKLANAEHGKVVLFFHAPWCPVCREADKNFSDSSVPDSLTLLKTDYDSSQDLKKKYGVTYQHTFVQVNKDGTLIKKWSGSSDYDDIKTQLN